MNVGNDGDFSDFSKNVSLASLKTLKYTYRTLAASTIILKKDCDDKNVVNKSITWCGRDLTFITKSWSSVGSVYNGCIPPLISTLKSLRTWSDVSGYISEFYNPDTDDWFEWYDNGIIGVIGEAPNAEILLGKAGGIKLEADLIKAVVRAYTMGGVEGRVIVRGREVGVDGLALSIVRESMSGGEGKDWGRVFEVVARMGKDDGRFREFTDVMEEHGVKVGREVAERIGKGMGKGEGKIKGWYGGKVKVRIEDQQLTLFDKRGERGGGTY